MDFKKKYLKYKKKYLELKNQIGGWFVLPVSAGKNTIRINGLPTGTTLVHLEAFLKSKSVPISINPGMQIGNDFLINFKDNATAVASHKLVVSALAGPPPYNPGILIAPPAIAPPAFLRPWSVDSKLLFIALPIAQSSELGKEIDFRVTRVTGTSPFNNFGQVEKLISPHISLLSINIPIGSKLDLLLSKKTFFKSFVVIITLIFRASFDVATPNPVHILILKWLFLLGL